MIDVRKALTDLNAAPGDIVALPKKQMAELLGELLARQERTDRSSLNLFTVAAMPTA